MALSTMVALALLLGPAQAAQETPKDEADVVRLASSAFEYRDFNKVIELLNPWVHPPRIRDRDRLREARRLLGISLHIQGQVPAAREEFAQVLLDRPDLKLDPFLVPPNVIATFEETREAMKPLLDQIRKERREAQPEPEPEPEGRIAPWMAYFTPVGLTHFLILDEVGLGVIFAVVQIAGLVANIYGFAAANAMKDENGRIQREEAPRFDRLRVVQFAGLATFAAGFIASGVHAHVSLLAMPEPPAATPEAGFSGGIQVTLTWD